MERRILLAAVAALAGGLAVAASIGGCGLETFGLPDLDAAFLDQLAGGGDGSDDAGSADGSTTGADGSVGDGGITGDARSGDASAGDTGSVACATGFACGTLGCMATCQGCAGAPLECASTGRCESSCSACPSRNIECYLCDSGLPVGRCDTNSASECLGANYQHCSCAILPCLSPAQVCTNVPGQGIHSECRTCGEPKTNGGGCGFFQQCNESAATCN